MATIKLIHIYYYYYDYNDYSLQQDFFRQELLFFNFTDIRMSACPSIIQSPTAGFPCSLLPGSEVYFDNSEKASRKLAASMAYPPRCTELVDSPTWLRRYGLRANKLTYQSILSMIGFKQMQDYEDPLKKQITSKYGKGLFLKTTSSDGTVYNASQGLLISIVVYLTQSNRT